MANRLDRGFRSWDPTPAWDHRAVSSACPATVSPPATEDSPTPARAELTQRELVLGVAFVLVAAHLVLRVWMLWPSWFYGDDYALIGQARTQGLTSDYLAETYGGRFMPLGRLAMWVVADAGPLDWHVAALIVVAMVALADLACIWMLVELFGRRWGVLLPLAAYLGSAVVMPATMWWAASLDQLPLQAAMFAAVAAWARHLRTGRTLWWVVAVLAVVLGMIAFVKGLLVLVVLGWLTLAHFSTGGPWERMHKVVRRWPAGVVALAGSGVAYLTWYLATVGSIVSTGRDAPVAGDLARTMLGEALPVGLLGGPWRWGATNHPVALADAPGWSTVVAWLVLAAVVAGLSLRRRRTGRVWALLALYAGLAYVLLLTTRAPLVGSATGLEYRYLTDILPVAVLCLGLATMSLRAGDQPTEARLDPPLRLPDTLTTRLPVVAAVALAVSGLVSSVGYARLWHTDHPAHEWFDQVRADLGDRGAVDVADASVPADVVSGFVSPWNTLSRLLPQAGLEVSFPTVSTRPAHVDDTGHVTQGFVEPVILAAPGPQADCGYRIGSGAGSDLTVTVPFEREVPAGVYWLRIPYLASTSDTLGITAGAGSGEAQVSKGLGSIFVNLAQGADDVTIRVTGGATVCVGDVQAGPLVEGPPW